MDRKLGEKYKDCIEAEKFRRRCDSRRRETSEKRDQLVKEQNNCCAECGNPFQPHDLQPGGIQVHHIVAIKDFGTDNLANLEALHPGCHNKITCDLQRRVQTRMQAPAIPWPEEEQKQLDFFRVAESAADYMASDADDDDEGFDEVTFLVTKSILLQQEIDLIKHLLHKIYHRIDESDGKKASGPPQ